MGVSHDVELPGGSLFFATVHLHGAAAPVRRFLPDLVRRIWAREVDPGRVFAPSLALAQAAEGYTAMDEGRSIKAFPTL